MKNLKSTFLLPFILFIFSTAGAQVIPTSPAECPPMQIWDYERGTCAPLAMTGMPMKMWMVHGNAFLVLPFTEGPRGRDQMAAPNMIMADIGSSVGNIQYINLDLMLTFEKWTFPERGYPELLQIGETDKNELPYIDGQHPHSSPIMGLTLSDTVSLGGKDHFKIFFAPRGQATDGPIAYIHRVTGMINPDAPLGHHIAQDVSHISSTVIGESFRLGKATLEVSVFNGKEPEPTKTDLPIGKLNSGAYRFIYEFTNDLYAMASGAYIKDPEKAAPDIDRIYRYSASVYYDKKFENGFIFHNTFIFGLVNFYDHFSKLRSMGDEFLIRTIDFPHNLWGRFEILERGGNELNIPEVRGVKWVSALTLGYTYDLLKSENGKLGIGASVTNNFLPPEFESAYGKDPLAGKVFIQLRKMMMGEF